MPAAARQQQRSVEERTRAFYDNEGWVAGDDGVTGEDAHFRNTAAERVAYDKKCEGKAKDLLAGFTGDLLIAGPGDFPKSHALASEPFDAVQCVDISEQSLAICRGRLGDKGEYKLGSLLNLPVADNSVDAALCAHVLFHIDKDDQAQAVSELIRAVKPGGRVVFIYVNPNAPLMLIQRLLKFFGVHKMLKADKLYCVSHPPRWWDMAAKGCSVTIHPYDVMSRNQMRALLPLRALRSQVFQWAGDFENRHPRMAARLWSYIAVEINKPA